MDEKSNTQICRSIALGAPEAESNRVTPRPMYLIVVSGGTPGAMLRLSSEVARLGRSHESSMRFADLSVSRRHATIVADSRGDAWLTDQESSNGTYLNGSPIESRVPYRLGDGDRVQFGSSTVVKFVRLDPTDEQFQRELFERTVRDPLTGLYNRAFFLDQIGPLAERGAARGLGLAALMLDVDHFKKINDSYGHDVGDQVLREVAAVLRESTRAEDLVARYGGEEFVLAIPVASPDQASERAERIRVNLVDRQIICPGAGRDSSSRISVTASLGLAFAQPGRDRSAPCLITAADRCLYQAKRGGRNRTVLRVDPGPILASDIPVPLSGV